MEPQSAETHGRHSDSEAVRTGSRSGHIGTCVSGCIANLCRKGPAVGSHRDEGSGVEYEMLWLARPEATAASSS